MNLMKRLPAIVFLAFAFAFAGTARADDIVPPKVYTVTPGGVNLSEGSYTFTDTDLAIGPLKLERFHLGGFRDPNTPFFGTHMSHNFDIYVAPNHRTQCSDDKVTCETFDKPIVHMGLSASGTFYQTLPPYVIIQQNSDDAYVGDLRYNASGAYEYTDAAGDIYTFSTTVASAGSPNSFRVANIVFADGRRQDFSYNGSGQLKLVSDSAGYAIVFDYAANGNVSAACGFDLAVNYVSATSTCTSATLKVSYGYSTGTPANLTSVTDVLGNVTTYGYDGNEISCVTPPGFSACQVTNSYGNASARWQVTQQTFIDGSTWHFSYTGDYTKPRDPDAYPDSEPTSSTLVTDPNSNTSGYSFVETSPYTATDANGHTTTYRYHGGFDYMTPEPSSASENFGQMLVDAVLPEGNEYQAQYGVRNELSVETWKAKPGSGLSDIVKQYGHVANCDPPNDPRSCAKPIWVKDEKGNETDFTYASFGGVASEMQPAPAAGAARPLKLYTYVQKYAYIKSAGGALVAAFAPIWMPDTETDCQTIAGSSAATCDAAAPQLVISYQYGADGSADNLLLRGKVETANGVSLRTCYRYDHLGNKISETLPRAGLAVCP